MSPGTVEQIGSALERALGPARAPQLDRRQQRHIERRTRGARRDPHYSGLIRENWRLRGYDPDEQPEIAELAARGLLPIGGGAPGKGAAAFFVNLPPDGTYEYDVDYFNQETERNDVPQPPVAFTALGGGRIDQRISNVGILSNVRLMFVGSLVVAGTGTTTTTYQWPWNICKRVTLQANGQTSLIQSEGLDLRVRRQRLYRNPTNDISSAPNASTATANPAPGSLATGTYPVLLMYDLPITHDATTLTGALFAQSDSNYLNWTVEPALQADLFVNTGNNTTVLTGTFFPMLTFFDIPYVDTQKGRMVAIPDLRWLHGFIASNKQFQNVGDVAAPFIKNAGQLIAYYAYIDNGGAAQIAPGSCDEIRLEYGGNRRPRVYAGPVGGGIGGSLLLLEENTRNYNGLLQPGYICLDLENENPDRDIIYPRGLSELQLVLKINSGVTPNANAKVHFVEETLFSGT